METKAISLLLLSRGKVATIDAEDFDRLGRVKWSAKVSGKNTYAVRSVGGRRAPKRLWLHREVLSAPEGVEVDHINGDGLDNRKSNLRLATRAQNMRGRRAKPSGKASQFRGVSWFKRDSVWVAQIMVGNKNYYLGRFRCEESAARAYDTKAKELGFSPQACNFP